MKKIGLSIVCCTLVGLLYAVPARRGGVVFTQPDGSQMIVCQHGDEHFHWQTNEEGEWLNLGEDGFYRVTEALSREQIEAKRMASPRRVEYKSVPLNIAPRGLVILVNFADVSFETSNAELDSMLTGLNYSRNYSYTYKNETYNITSEGSARQYFYDSSNGQYNPQLDVVGPVTVSKNMSYYGKNDSYGNDSHADQMVSEACKLADTECNVDFTRYDNNNDGYVDFVFVIYAGFGEADGGGVDANTIWPHAWNLLKAAGTRCEVDNKLVDLYACGNELDYHSKVHTGIGTFCHEFSHVLGLPDFYVTNTAEHVTMNDWDIMDYGPYNNDGNTPPAYSAYERFFMGWLQPRLITEPENVVLKGLLESNEGLLISTTDEHNLLGNDPDPTIFYLIENRQPTAWDKHLPGHGMMLTKIQYNYTRWYQNTVNNSASQMGVDLIEADGKATTSGKAGDLFPAGASAYTKIADHVIEAIEEVGGVIKFKYKGGVEHPETAVGNTIMHQEVIAIYNILGQKQTTTSFGDLNAGTYIITTPSGSYKIVR